MSCRALSYKGSFCCPSLGSLRAFPPLNPFTLTGGEGRPLGFGKRSWAAHLLSLCDNSRVPVERVDQVLNGLFLGEIRQVDEVFLVVAARAQMGARDAQVSLLQDTCFPQLQA